MELFLIFVLALQIPSILSVSTSAIQPLDKPSTKLETSPTTSSATSQSTPTSITGTIEASTSSDSSMLTVSPTSTTASVLSQSTLSTASGSDSKTGSKSVPAGTTPNLGSFENAATVSNLLQDSGTSNVSDSLIVTDVTMQISSNTTDGSSKQITTEHNFESTTLPITQDNISDVANTTSSLSTSSPAIPTESVPTSAVASSDTTSVKFSTFPSSTTGTSSTNNADPNSTMKSRPTTTQSSKGDKSKQSPTSCEEKDSSFGEYGLPLSAVALAVCIIEFIIILVMMVRASKRRRKRHLSDDEKTTPKLKMLEIKDDTTKRSTNDDLHVYSLDYEKHVQEKIEEHKKKTKPPVADKPIGGVSSFMLTKQESMRSNLSNASSPDSPLSPAENKPLIKYHRGDDGDEPMVFNFSKRPSEILTKRRESGADEAGRRKSNASGGKFKSVPENKYDTDI